MRITEGLSKIFLSPKGWIEAIIGKSLNTAEYMILTAEFVTMMTLVEDKGIPVRVLIDLTATEELSPQIVPLAIKVNRDLDFEKIAVLGVAPSISAAIEDIRQGAGKTDTILVFGDRAEAETWLMAP